MHHDYDGLEWKKLSPDFEEATVVLKRGDTSWNPASTKEGREIFGPATVIYERRRSGISAFVED